MTNQLFMYPNFSKGGVSAVLRGRAANFPNINYFALFEHDRHGDDVFDSFENIQSGIVRPDRRRAYLTYITSHYDISLVSILSNPTAVSEFAESPDAYICYEFHSSDMNIVKSELDRLDATRVDEFRVPSEYMAGRLERLGSMHVSRRLRVVPNLVDSTVFGEHGVADFFARSRDDRSQTALTPLIWVGRFDRGKGYTHFLRALANLPNNYHAYFVVSLESDPSRMLGFLGEAAALGVSDRLSIFTDISPAVLANMFRSARDLGGHLVSTSLLESFGYSVAEALACGLTVRAFDLPVWREHVGFSSQGIVVPPGDVRGLAASIVS